MRRSVEEGTGKLSAMRLRSPYPVAAGKISVQLWFAPEIRLDSFVIAPRVLHYRAQFAPASCATKGC